MSVRANHSSPSGGGTRRPSPRRASDTTLANVASRTSSSQSAVRAGRARRVTPVRREPGDQFDGLRPLQRGDGPVGAAAPRRRRRASRRSACSIGSKSSAAGASCSSVAGTSCGSAAIDASTGTGSMAETLRRHVIHPDQRLLGVVQDGEHGIDVGTVEPDRRHGIDRPATVRIHSSDSADSLAGASGSPFGPTAATTAIPWPGTGNCTPSACSAPS